MATDLARAAIASVESALVDVDDVDVAENFVELGVIDVVVLLAKCRQDEVDRGRRARGKDSRCGPRRRATAGREERARRAGRAASSRPCGIGHAVRRMPRRPREVGLARTEAAEEASVEADLQKELALLYGKIGLFFERASPPML